MAIASSRGGSSTFAGLTDAASADLPSTNTPLADAITAIYVAIGLKADALAYVPLSANTNLTASAHANRTLMVTGARTLTLQVDATSGCSGDESFVLLGDGTNTSTIAAGACTLITPSGTSASTATAVGGLVWVQRVPKNSSGATQTNTYRVLSSAVVSAGTGVAYVHTMIDHAADVLSGSTTNTSIKDVTLPAIGVKDAVEAEIYFSKSGTAGNTTWGLYLGGTGVDGTLVGNFTAAASNIAGRVRLHFTNSGSQAQVGPNNSNGDFASATAYRTGAVDLSAAGIHMFVALQKGAGADVVQIEMGRVIIRPGV